MQPVLPAEQEVYKALVSRPAAAKMLSNCKHARELRTKSDSKLKASPLVLRVRQIHRMIIPQSESVRGALQDGL